MRKPIHVLILLLLGIFAKFSFAQNNLVPNPSFEDYSTCPTASSEIHVATPWIQTGGSVGADYFNVCNQPALPFPIPGFGAPVGVPSNLLGNQDARTDSGYAGFFTVESNPDNGSREYIQVPLTEPMERGTNYCVQFYVSLSDNSSNASDGLSAYFTTSQVPSGSGNALVYPAQFRSNTVITDKENWVEVSGNFLAADSYQYLTLGNFDAVGTTNVVTAPASTDTTSPVPSLPMPGAYYYIDDVYVGEGSCPNICGLALEATTTPVTCGESDGSINIITSGGSGNFTYQWSTGATSASINNLSDGIYSVTVSDPQGCDVTQYVLLTQDTDLEIEVSGTDATCTEGGTASVDITGGTSPYQIMWENSQTTEEVFDLPAGTHSVTVIDEEGCSKIDSIEVAAAAPIGLSETITDIACDDTSNSGAIGIVPVGGNPPYEYMWSNGSTAGAQINLYSGVYTVTVTDNGGCSVTETYSIGSGGLSPVISQSGNTLISTQGASTYQWYHNGNPIQGATSPEYTITESGTYWVVVSDGSGCEVTSNVIETTYSGIEEDGISGLDLSIYPNPNNGLFVLNIEANKKHQLNLLLRNYTGQVVYEQKVNVEAGNSSTTINVDKLAGDTYLMELQDEKARTTRRVVILK